MSLLARWLGLFGPSITTDAVLQDVCYRSQHHLSVSMPAALLP